jgi:phospholipid/cholesterol/gamma-HCH transport system ATP-binding protein
MPGDLLLQCTEVSVGYDDKAVLEHVDLEIRRGEIVTLLGGSGCGKSTLLRNLVGLQTPVKGRVSFLGRDFTDAGEAQRREQLKDFGMLFQGGALWTSLTLRENVALPLEEYTQLTRAQIGDLATLRLGQLGLTGFEDYYPSEISGGMRKRAGLARALALDPDILFFDEPSAGLDPITSRRLDELILELRDGLGATVVIVSHELPSLFSICDDGVFIDAEAKTAIGHGAPRDLRDRSANPTVQAFMRRLDPDAAAGARADAVR